MNDKLAKPALRVVAAIIWKQGKILLARKAKGTSNQGLWEFPGGKLEANESELACAKREILEELGLEVEPISVIGCTSLSLSRGGQLTLIGVFCRAKESPRSLTDHDAWEWVTPAHIARYHLAEADKPLVTKTLTFLEGADLGHFGELQD
ncbi:MAG: NUDIX domain-containing protein [Pseudobacteriovorax sp.]|nr:NUDIX domain-containing protein [Pseudobacteriovorax sp.]